MSANLVNIIFGMKIRQARTEANMSLTEFAAACDLSPSYVTEIEKGRKYPRADKIMRIAEVMAKAMMISSPSAWMLRWPTWKPRWLRPHSNVFHLRSLAWSQVIW
ncbi:MAG: helix-turn-helix transcriptional regulator [Anaerolineae bacterium]|nr:helix-turn-helix transcriptional regulator [Anaerolineae bacterium]